MPEPTASTSPESLAPGRSADHGSSGDPAPSVDEDIDPLVPRPDEWSRETTLRDGTPVLLRQIRPSDRARIVEGLARLSPASRYLRFHSAVDQLSEAQLDELTQVDHHDHDAIVALDLDRPDRPGVGVARFIREPYEPEVAEAAITVADEYHGQGAGTILLGALAARARDEGISVFRSYVLDGNPGMLEVFDHLGAHRELETDGLWRVDLAVPEDEADVPASGAGRAFLELARDQRRLASILPPIWSRWRRSSGVHAPDSTSEDPDAGPDDGRGDDTARDEVEDPAAAEFEELRDELDGWLQHREDR
jgi:RimJ/RimL family protein N-acetyltransferase